MEDKRVTFFLLGLILSFSLIFVGLQYKSHPYDPDFDAESLEDLAQDLELSTPSEQKDMVSAEAPAAPVSKSITQEVKAADKVEEAPQKINSTTSELVIGDGEGAVDGAKVKEAVPETAVDNTNPSAMAEAPINFTVVQQIPVFPGGWSASCNGLPRTSNIRSLHRMPRYKARWSAPLLLIRMARCAM